MMSRLILGLLCCMVIASPVARPVEASEPAGLVDAQESAVARIALAIRQRYIMQMIAKGTCFAMTSINAARNAQQAWVNIELFDTATQVLATGSPKLEQAPETDPSVLAALANLETNWLVYRAATRQILSRDWHTVPMEQILRLNGVVLDQVNAAVEQIILAHSADLVTGKFFAATLNIAGRQRMLVQKAAREMCFISLKIDEDMMRAGLADTVKMFEASLYALENGDYEMSVIDPPSLAILKMLWDINALWEEYRTALDPVIDGGNPSSEDITLVERLNLPLLDLSQQLVDLYLK